MLNTPPAEKPAVFLRQATGLIRELSLMDAFILGFAQLNILLALTEVFAWAPYIFPGAHLGISFLIATPASLIFGLVYAFFSMAMPRSGGDYVWVSRTLSPPLGFAVNFFLTVLILSWGALNVQLIPSMFAPPLLYVLGLQSWIPALTGKTGMFLIGTACVIIFTALLCLGIRTIARMMKWLFWIVSAGTVVWLVLLWAGSHDHFVQLFHSAWNGDYNGVINDAHKAGYSNSGSGVNSLYALVYTFQMFMGFQMVGYFSGEVKNAKRNAATAILGGWFLGAVAFLLLSFGIYHYYGGDFLGSIAYLYSSSPDNYHLPLPGYLSSLSLLLSTSPIVQFIMGISFLATVLWIVPTTWVYASRNIFAWSFDRIMPEKLSEVNEKTHSPVNVTILVGVVVEILLALTIYTKWWGYMINLVGVMVICFFIVSIAGMVFPYRRPDLFNKAPSAAQKRWMGIPVFSIVSFLSAIVMIFVGYVSWTVPSISGGVTWSSLISSLMVFLIAFPIFYLAKWLNKRKGIDMTLAYKEIPPE